MAAFSSKKNPQIIQSSYIHYTVYIECIHICCLQDDCMIWGFFFELNAAIF